MDAGAKKSAQLGSVVFHLKGGIHSRRSGDYNDGLLTAQAVNHLTMATSAQGTSPGHSCKTGFQGAAAQDPSLRDQSDDSYEIVSVIDGSPGNPDDSASENRYALINKFRFPRADQLYQSTRF